MRHDRSGPEPSALRLTVHPGLGKTATTSVQRVLRAHPRLWFGGVASHQPDHPFRRAFEALLREPVDRHTWRARIPPDVRIARLAEAISEGLRSSPDGVGVLSDEAILGHVGDDDGWRGPYIAGFGTSPGWRVAEVRLARLARVIGRIAERLAADGVRLDVRTVLTVRRQGTLLASSWAWNHEYYRGAGIRGVDDLLAAVAEDRFPRLRFSGLADLIERHGFPSVTVLPLEALAQRPAAFWEELSRIVGTDVEGADAAPSNRRRDDGHRWRTRTVANRPVARIGTSALLERLVAPAPEGLRDRITHALRARSGDGPALELPPELLERIDAAYADDLDALQPRSPFDLRAFGYPGADRPGGGAGAQGSVS